MLIPPEAIDEVKRSSDLAALARARGIELRKKGRELVGLCPFHEEKSPSFFINPKQNVFHCHGCDERGDAIRLLMKLDHLTFREAFESLGGHVENAAPAPRKAPAEKPAAEKKSANGGDDDSGITLDVIANEYHETLLRSPEAQAYLTSRGLGDVDLWRAFRIGYADGSLARKLPAVNGSRDALVRRGILLDSERERFHGCVVVPMTDAAGAVVNLYGRPVDREGHYYLPGPRAGLVNRERIAAGGDAILTESIFDSLSIVAAGILETVPLYGANGFTEEHRKLLAERRPNRVIVALDSDAVGQRASSPLVELLRGDGHDAASIVLPFKDPNAMLQALGPASFRQRWKDLIGGIAKEMSAIRRNEAGALTFDRGERHYEIRTDGGARGSRMRVGLKVTRGERCVIDSADLLSAKSRTLFASRASEGLGCEASEIERDLLALALALESTPPEGPEPPATPPPVVLTDEARAEGLAFLMSPDLLDRIVRDLDALGYVGEATAKQIGYLVAVSRKLEAPMSMIILSPSGSGKSGLAEVLEQLVPPEDVVMFSRITPQALYYMEKDALVHRFVVIEERAGSVEADYSIRTLQSKKRLVLAVPIKDPATGRIKTEVFEIHGPAAFLETTTETALNHENATRCFEMWLDESEAQTRRVHEAQKLSKTASGRKAGAEREAILRRHHNAQRLLEKLAVVIPYAPLIEFPSAWLRTRRDHLRFLNLIETIAFLHQHQRERQSDPALGVYIEATIDDYARAYALAADLLGDTLADLKKTAREFLESLRAMVSKIIDGTDTPRDGVAWTRRMAREATGLPDHRVRALLDDLVSLEYVIPMNGGQGKTATYRLASDVWATGPALLSGLLTPEELGRRWRSKPKDPSS